MHILSTASESLLVRRSPRYYPQRALRRPRISLPKVTRVLLQDGQSVHVRCEVLLCASVLHSPAVLFASSVGPRSLLNDLHIPVEQDPPGVRANMIDHSVLFQLFELRSSDKGVGLGHLDVKDPVFLLGMLTDCLVNEGLPRYLLERALVEDGINGAERDALMEPGRCFLEVLVLYHPLSPPLPRMGHMCRHLSYWRS